MLAYGQSTNWIEDQYNMNTVSNAYSPKSISFSGDSSSFGSGKAAYPQEVIISCANKQGRVRGSLSGNIGLNIQAEWQEIFQGGIASMVGGILGTANSLVQYRFGQTIQQPWMNRKIYKNTKPFSFTLPINFVAIDNGEHNAKNEVVMPCLALISFLYPRKYKSGNSTVLDYVQEKARDVEAMNIPFISSGAGYIAEGDETGAVNSILNAFTIWNIPGPSLLKETDDTSQEKGDAVDVIIGNMFNLGNCYLENVNVQFGSSFDSQGYPLSAHVEVKCTCADSVVCNNKGDMFVNKIDDQAGQLNNILTSVGGAIEKTTESIGKLFSAYAGFYSGNLSVQEKK